MTAIASHTTVLAATDLVSGSHSLYTIGVGVLVVLILLGGGGARHSVFLRRPNRRDGDVGRWSPWSSRSVVGSGYAIYASTKRTVDRTGITTGQFGQ